MERAAADETVTVELEDGRRFSGAELLVAVGRTPQTDSLGVESLGLEPGKSIEVDASLRVPGHDWLYVVGDANGRVLLTHMGKYQARLAADHILGKEVSLRSDGRLSPRVIFTEPQVAAVGYTLAGAREAGLKRAPCVGGRERGLELHRPRRSRQRADRDRRERGVLIGATFTGVEVAEWLQAATIAIVGEVPLERLAHAVPALSDAQRGVAAAAGSVRGRIAMDEARARGASRGRSQHVEVEERLEGRIAAFAAWHYRFEFDGGVSHAGLRPRGGQPPRAAARALLRAAAGARGGLARGPARARSGLQRRLLVAGRDRGGSRLRVRGGRAPELHRPGRPRSSRRSRSKRSRYGFAQGDVLEHELGQDFDVVLCLGLMDTWPGR